MQRSAIAAALGALAVLVLVAAGFAAAAVRHSLTAKAESVGANWESAGGDLAGNRFSRLNQIDVKNVNKLKLAFATTYDGTIQGEAESEPLEANGVLYIPTPDGNVVAASATTGKVIWEYKTPNPIKSAFPGLLTFGQTSRDLGMDHGDIFVMDNTNTLFALDRKTGAVAWKTLLQIAPGLETPGDPVYYNGVIYVGVDGAESGRGIVYAVNAHTGAVMWQTFTVNGQSPTASASVGGGSVWMYMTIDPKLGLLYATTGNPGGNPTPNNLWANSVIAMSMKTGAITWAFQAIHQDLWDYDCPTPPVLFNYKFQGVVQPALEMTCKSDYHFELNRRTGDPILPVVEKPTPMSDEGLTPDPAAMLKYNAPTTEPIPAGKSEIVPHCPGDAQLPNPAPDGTNYVRSCTYATPEGSTDYVSYGPGALGGQDHTPLSYDPKLGYMYFCETVSALGGKIGGKATGSFTNVPVGWSGSVAAVNVKNNNLVWLHKLDASTDGMCFSGSTTTAGGIDFVGSNKGKFYAFDAATGKVLWSYTGTQYIAAPPIVYAVKGKEYVAVQAGGQAPLLGAPATPRTDVLEVFTLK
jgi:glucose dehydrogenase